MSNLLRSLLLLALLPTATLARADNGMVVTGATSQPVGHYEFCRRHPEECGVNRSAGAVRMSDAAWQTLVSVNTAVNNGIAARTDQEMHGVPELWSYPTTEGDCEDYALLKQYMLEREGFPRSALLLTVVRQPNGDGHAVLGVRIEGSDYILDNLDNRVLDWRDTPYRYLKRQSERDSSRWVAIEDGRDMLVGSVR